MNREGLVIWITGLSGAGKSSIAKELIRQLQAGGQPAILLDGDAVRTAVNDAQTGHDRAGRLTNAMRICHLAKLLADQRFTVVVPTMSLFKEVHRWNRCHLPDYFEVLVQVSLEVLKIRDARGLYSRALQGQANNVVGLDLNCDLPETPDLVLANDLATDSFFELARRILDTLSRRTTANITPPPYENNLGLHSTGLSLP